MKDRQLVQSIKNGFKEHRITSVHGNDINTMIDRFMSYTPLARDYIMNYYSQLDKTEKTMNGIVKTDFERKYFYISGTDALIGVASGKCGFTTLINIDYKKIGSSQR